LVGEPAPECGTKNGRDDNAEAEKRHRDAAFFGGKTFEKNGLRERLKRAAASALNRAGDQNHAEICGGSAGEGRNREDDEAGQEKISAAEFEREPSAGGQNDCVGYEVAGEHPRRFVGGSREAAGNMWKSDGRDRSIEDFHKRWKHDRSRNEIRAAVGAPRLQIALF